MRPNATRTHLFDYIWEGLNNGPLQIHRPSISILFLFLTKKPFRTWNDWLQRTVHRIATQIEPPCIFLIKMSFDFFSIEKFSNNFSFSFNSLLITDFIRTPKTNALLMSILMTNTKKEFF